MSNIKRQIVSSDIFQKVTARLHQHGRLHQLKGMYSEIIEKYQGQQPTLHIGEKCSNYIWLCWWQGEDLMTPLVRECCARIKRFNPNKQVIVITENNMEQYVTFPEYILEKYHKGIISKTHMSDLLRAELLARYGGAWMDATIYTFSSIPERCYEKTLYTGKCKYNKKDYNVSRNRWTTYFWVSPWPEHTLFRFISDFWQAYWKDHDTLTEYFLTDYVIDLGYRTIPFIRKELDAVDTGGCGENFWILLHKLRDDYSIDEMKNIQQKNWMQKLSYKGEDRIQKQAAHPEKSFYKVLFMETI